MSNPRDPAAPSGWQAENKGKAKSALNEAARDRSGSPKERPAKAPETVRLDGPLEPSKWQTANKEKAREPFNQAASGAAKPQKQASGKVSETVRNDRPHMAPSPSGPLRDVAKAVLYERVSQERIELMKKTGKTVKQAREAKQNIAAKIAQTRRTEIHLGNEKDAGRKDDRGQ